MDALIAGCKVNLGLRITGVRADGYHELDSLFWPLPEPCDRLCIQIAASGGLSLDCDTPGLDPARNTLTRAYAAFASVVPNVPALHVTLRKGIPLGAGLGGGSSDAAALLHWLNARQEHPLDHRALAALALNVGADTPFFLQNTPCRVRGIGEKLEPQGRELAGLRLLLVCPGIHVSTPQAYADYDARLRANQGEQSRNDLTKPTGKANGTFLSGARFAVDMHNDLEAVVFSRYPQLAKIKAALLGLGAAAVAMSGSGASIVALFDSKALGPWQTAAHVLQRENQRVYTHVLYYTGM